MRLNLGCGPKTPSGWINVDYFIGARLMKNPLLRWIFRKTGIVKMDWSPEIYIHDLRRPLPWSNDSVDAVYSSHTLEHLSKEAGAHLLTECYRTLKPGGVIRIVVPDLKAFVEQYLEGRFSSRDFIESLGVGTTEQGDGLLKTFLAPYVRFPHRCMYDPKSLVETLREIGFQAELRKPFDSGIDGIAAIEDEDRTVDAVIAEGRKLPA